MTCKFCTKEGKCRSGKKSTCDFKTIEYSADGLTARINEEFDNVENMIMGLKNLNDKVKKQDQMVKIADKIIGMKILIETLKTEFNIQYKSKRGPLAFIKLVTMAQRYGGK